MIRNRVTYNLFIYSLVYNRYSVQHVNQTDLLPMYNTMIIKVIVISLRFTYR